MMTMWTHCRASAVFTSWYLVLRYLGCTGKARTPCFDVFSLAFLYWSRKLRQSTPITVSHDRQHQLAVMYSHHQQDVSGLCLGSRPIVFDGDLGQGIAIVFNQGESETESSSLRLVVVHEKSSYQGHLDPADTKVHLDDSGSSRLRALASFVLEQHDGVTVNYQPTIGGEQLMMTIRQKRDNGIVKMLWSGKLEKESNAFSILNETLNQQCQQIIQANSDKHQLQQHVREWKATIDSMQRQGQLDKDILTHQFSQLYATTLDKLQEMKKELDRLQRQEQAFHLPLNATASKPRSTREQTAEDFAAGQPDDHDALWDSSLVQRMTETSKSGSVTKISKVRKDAPKRKSAVSTKVMLNPHDKLEKAPLDEPEQSFSAPGVPCISLKNRSNEPSSTGTRELNNTDDLFSDGVILQMLNRTESRKKRGREEDKEASKLPGKALDKKLLEAGALLDDSDDDCGW